MALFIRAKAKLSVPRPLHGGRIIALIVRSSLCMGTMLGIGRSVSGRTRSRPLTPDVRPDMQRHLQSRRIPWWRPILMLAARPMFALVMQLALAAGFRLKRHPRPLQKQVAGGWCPAPWSTS
jgi:hypothetical protein